MDVSSRVKISVFFTRVNLFNIGATTKGSGALNSWAPTHIIRSLLPGFAHKFYSKLLYLSLVNYLKNTLYTIIETSKKSQWLLAAITM